MKSIKDPLRGQPISGRWDIAHRTAQSIAKIKGKEAKQAAVRSLFRQLRELTGGAA